jgi:hypothetical protein
MAGEQVSGGSELGRFLRARRTRITPGEVGLTIGPGMRRTPGLRREELATLAGISIDYYTRLERGKETRPSPAVIDSLAAPSAWTMPNASTCATSPRVLPRAARRRHQPHRADPYGPG